MKKIILITGNKGHGKDTVADMICELMSDTQINKVALADTFKDVLCTTFGISREVLDELKNNKENRILSRDSRLDTTMRNILQNFGEGSKKYFGDDVWCKNTDEKLIDGINIITDLRLLLEEKYFKDKYECYIIKIQKPNKQSADQHISEAEINKIKEDFMIVNDGSLEDLREKVKDIIKEIRI